MFASENLPLETAPFSLTQLWWTQLVTSSPPQKTSEDCPPDDVFGQRLHAATKVVLLMSLKGMMATGYLQISNFCKFNMEYFFLNPRRSPRQNPLHHP